MTEAQWLACEDPEAMVRWLAVSHGSDRKFRLFGCAVARLLPPIADEERDTRRAAAIVAAEKSADGKRGGLSKHRTWVVASQQAFDSALGLKDEKLRGRWAELAALVREVFGIPTRPAKVPETWRTADVTALALAAYEKRGEGGELEAVRLSVLADALEDAGCTDAEVLGHLRGGGQHVRGCWALDLLLGKG